MIGYLFEVGLYFNKYGMFSSPYRQCGLPSTRNSDNPCKKPLNEQRSCNDLACPSFGSWTEWSPCSGSKYFIPKEFTSIFVKEFV